MEGHSCICLEAAGVSDAEGQLVSQERGDGIPYLVEGFCLGAAEFEPVRETLEPGSFPYGDASASAVREPHALHVARSPGEIAACDGACGTVGMQVTWIDTVGFTLVGCYVFVLSRGQDFVLWVRAVHGIGYGVAYACLHMFDFGKLES